MLNHGHRTGWQANYRFFSSLMDMPRISMTTGCLQGNRAWVQVYRVLIFEESEVRNNNHCTRLYGVPIQRDTERWQYNRARKSRRIRFPNSHLASGRCLSSVILQVHDRNLIHVLYTRLGNKQDRGTGICPASRMHYYTILSQ